MLETFTTEREIELISKIYSAGFGDGHWSDVTDELSQLAPFASVLIHGACPIINYEFVARCDQWEISTIESYAKYYHSISPWIDNHTKQSVGQIYTSADLNPDLPTTSPEFYYDWALPAQKGGGVAAKLFATRQSYGVITLDYGFDKSASYDSPARSLLEKVAPHIQRAFQIRSRLLHQASELAALQAQLQRLSVAIFVLDYQCRIDWMNDQAQQMLERGAVALEGVGRKLAVKNQMAQNDLATSVAAICNPASTARPENFREIRFLAKRDPERWGLINLCPAPVESRILLPGMTNQRVMVTLEVEADWTAPSPDVVGRILGLTKAEAQVAIAVSEGFSIREIASARQASEHTVRNQIKSCLQKTGGRTQRDLVRHVLSISSSPVQSHLGGTSG